MDKTAQRKIIIMRQALCEYDEKKDLSVHTYGDWVIATKLKDTTVNYWHYRGDVQTVCQ